MAKGLEAATFATVARDGEKRVSRNGNTFSTLLLVTESGERDDQGKDVPVFLNTICFGDLAEVAAGLEKGRRVYVEGALAIGVWHGENGPRLNAQLKASRLEPTQIGRNKPKVAEKATGVATAAKPPEGCPTSAARRRNPVLRRLRAA